MGLRAGGEGAAKIMFQGLASRVEYLPFAPGARWPRPLGDTQAVAPRVEIGPGTLHQAGLNLCAGRRIYDSGLEFGGLGLSAQGFGSAN